MKKKSLPTVSVSFPVLCIGIASNARDYRMAHFLNREFSFALERADSKIVVPLKEQELILPYFHATDNNFSYFLFENKNKSGILFANYRNFNYWLIIRSKTQLPPEDIYSDCIGRIEVVIAAFRLDKENEIRQINDFLPE